MYRFARLAALLGALLLVAACGTAEDVAEAPEDAGDEPAVDDPAEEPEEPADASEDDAPDAAEVPWSGYQGGDDGVLRVAFVYVGPVGDAGWSYRHDVGRQDMEAALGDRVETTYLESVEEGAAAERVFEDLARDGYDLIFGTSFGYMDSMVTVAEQFPETVFMHATGYMTAPNLGTYFHRDEQGKYLEGVASGAASETGQLGYVAAYPIPDAIRRINAFTLGAQSVNPEATVQVVWTSSWFDPPVETEAANSLIDAGVDVLAQDIDGPATGQAAEERGAKWAGFNSDMSAFAPEAWLTATVWEWGPTYTRTAEEVWDGTWESGQYFGTMADGGMTMAPFGDAVDDETRARIDEVLQAMIDDEFDPLTGEFRDQDGEVRYGEGEAPTLEERLTMDYFVEGVIGSPGG
jgi:basic membrane protein A and related proteins